jgi:hypothetical protein
MLHPVALKVLDAPIVHDHREDDDELALGVTQQGA